MSGSRNDVSESCLNALRYAEVVIKYKGHRYHIEAGPKKYTIGVFKKETYEIDYFLEVKGNTYEEAYNKLISEPLFNGSALKDIVERVEWLEG